MFSWRPCSYWWDTTVRTASCWQVSIWWYFVSSVIISQQEAGVGDTLKYMTVFEALCGTMQLLLVTVVISLFEHSSRGGTWQQIAVFCINSAAGCIFRLFCGILQLVVDHLGCKCGISLCSHIYKYKLYLQSLLIIKLKMT